MNYKIVLIVVLIVFSSSFGIKNKIPDVIENSISVRFERNDLEIIYVLDSMKLNRYLIKSDRVINKKEVKDSLFIKDFNNLVTVSNTYRDKLNSMKEPNFNPHLSRKVDLNIKTQGQNYSYQFWDYYVNWNYQDNFVLIKESIDLLKREIK